MWDVLIFTTLASCASVGAFDATAAQCVATTEQELIDCIVYAAPGGTIWLPGSTELHFVADGSEGQSILPLIRTSNLTIASDRGLGSSEGARIRVTVSPNWVGSDDGPYLFKVEGKPDTDVGETGDGFTLRGLRLVGPYPRGPGAKRLGALAVEPFVKHSLTDTCVSDGVQVTCGGQPICDLVPCDVVVENVTLSGWSEAAVWIAHSEGVVRDSEIIRNFDHYGVLVEGPADVTISGNDFDHNWHDVSGDGHPLQRYTADGNTFWSTSDPRAQRLDVHPYCTKGTIDCLGANALIAGERYVIRNNHFELPARQDFACPSMGVHHAPIVIRGVPSQGALLENNYFETSDGFWQFYCDDTNATCVRSECPDTPQGVTEEGSVYG